MATETQSPSERRATPRVRADVPVTWRAIHLDGRDADVDGRLLDVSDGGCCLQPAALPDPLGIGAVVEIDLRVQGRPVTRRGLVVADPRRDGRLHLAISTPSREPTLRALLG